jgi:hypothetical protein
MKIINIGNYLINLDKVILVDTENRVLHLEDEKRIELTEQQVEEFVVSYNLSDTDETGLLLKVLTRAVMSNPEYLTREGIQERVTISVRYHKLEDYLKEITEGAKIKELPLNKLITVYKLIQEKVKEIEKEYPF